VEESDGKLSAFEFTLSKRPSSAPSSWGAAYPEASFEAISFGDFLPFVGVQVPKF
jgi:hypothetical protein